MVVRRILQFNFAETRAGFSAFLNHWSEWLKKQFHYLIKLLHWWPKQSLFTRSKQIIYCLGFQWPDGFSFEIFWHVIGWTSYFFNLLYLWWCTVVGNIHFKYCSMFTFNICHYTVLLSPGRDILSNLNYFQPQGLRVLPKIKKKFKCHTYTRIPSSPSKHWYLHN